jgi:hypothetical protein
MAPTAPDRALRARTAMIGRDPLARNRDARKSWREAQMDEIIGLPETFRGSVATGFCNAYFALRTLFLMRDPCVSSRPVEPS